ncbi:MAG: hypothetical protein, partial [Olavius algarvensis Gamma 1 endosymbiont]
RNLTSQAGLIPVIKFLDGLGFSGLFHQVVRHERSPMHATCSAKPFFWCSLAWRAVHVASASAWSC